MSAVDVEGDDLTFSAINGDTYLEVSGNILTVIPNSDFNGNIEIDVMVSDGQDSDSTSFIVTVLPVNDSPIVVNTIDDVTLLEDDDPHSIDISNVFYDIGLVLIYLTNVQD